MKRAFQTYSSTGLLAGALAALCFGLEARLSAVLPTAYRPVWAILISLLGPACCLMLPGLLIKPSLGRFFRFVVGTLFGSLVIIGARTGVCVNYSGGPPPPWPDLDTFGFYYLVALCLVGFLATFYLSGKSGHWFAKTLSPLVACTILGLFAGFLHWLFPPRIVLTEKWEYLTIVIGGPLFGLVLWGALDIRTKGKDAEVAEGNAGNRAP